MGFFLLILVLGFIFFLRFSRTRMATQTVVNYDRSEREMEKNILDNGRFYVS